MKKKLAIGSLFAAIFAAVQHALPDIAPIIPAKATVVIMTVTNILSAVLPSIFKGRER